MHEYDDDVLECFLENQLQLFPERGRRFSGRMYGGSGRLRRRGNRVF